MKLRPFQERATDLVRASYASGHRAPLLQLPTGGGKTVIMAHAIKSAVARGREVLVNVHRAELVTQTVAKLEGAGVTDLRIIQAASDLGNPTAKVAVASIQTLTNWNRDRMPRADLVIFDECFPAGTLVDGRPIESLRVGDLVSSFNHETECVERRAIKRLFCSRPSALVTVHLTDGRAITCTAGHPFFDGANYTPAANLKPGDPVYGLQATQENRAPMCEVRHFVPVAYGHRNTDLFAGMPDRSTRGEAQADHDAVRGVRNDCDVCGERSLPSGERSTVLLDDLQRCVQGTRELDDNGSDEPTAGIRTHEGKQPDASRGYALEGQQATQGDRAPAEDAGRKRTRTRADGDASSQCAAVGMGAAVPGAYGASRTGLSDGLQDRYRQPGNEDRSRGGRQEPLLADRSDERRQEAGVSRVARVARVEVHKRRGADGFRSLCPDDLVFNIEVDGNHNYFVDGVLVHNCHHVVAKTWAVIAGHYANALLLGCTATPQRADGKGLGDIFDDLIIGASVAELTALGYLVPCRVWAAPRKLESAQVVLSPAKAYHEHAEGRRAVVFCCSLEHARTVADEMNAAGIRTDVVHGGLASTTRADTLARLRRGELDAVTNVHVLTEGWDDPAVAVCILARRPQHAGTFLQMVGRVLRPAPGKTHATLIDLCGSVHDHGPPEMEREFSLDGRGIKKVDRDAIRQCMCCGGVFLAGPLTCPLCGAALPRREMALPVEIGGELVDLATLPKLPPRAVTLSITAKYAGWCRACSSPIAVGEQIYWNSGGGKGSARHAECPIREAVAR